MITQESQMTNDNCEYSKAVSLKLTGSFVQLECDIRVRMSYYLIPVVSTEYSSDTT
jgi:hypothetical protein